MIDKHKHTIDLLAGATAGFSLATAIQVANFVATILAGLASLMTIVWYAKRFYDAYKEKHGK